MADLLPSKIILVVLTLLAAYCIIGIQVQNGFFDLMDASVAARPLKLSGSSEDMISIDTGSPALDGHLRGLVMFFWQTVSTESPSLSLASIYAAGQVVPMHTIILLGGLRAGNAGKIISYTTIWGCLYQTVPWGIVMPIYFLVHLSTSPMAKFASLRDKDALGSSWKVLRQEGPRIASMDSRQLTVLPLSLIMGFIIPTILAGLPPPMLTTVSQQQLLLIFWQGFPIWIATWQYLLSSVLSVFQPSSSRNPRSNAAIYKAVKRAHAFSFWVAASVHISTIAFVVFPALRPGYLALSPDREVTLGSVFMPMFTPTTLSAMHEGCLNLLQYDVYFACGAALVWACTLLLIEPVELMRSMVIVKALLLSILVGPGAAALALIWEQDEAIFVADVPAETKNK